MPTKRKPVKRAPMPGEDEARLRAMQALDAAHAALSHWFGSTRSDDTKAEVLWETSRDTLRRIHAALKKRA